jgi:hypothetical protein
MGMAVLPKPGATRPDVSTVAQERELGPAERARANGYIGSVADDVDTSGWVNDADGHRQSPRGSDTARDGAGRRRHRCVALCEAVIHAKETGR